MKILSKDLLFSNTNKVISSDVTTTSLDRDLTDLIFANGKFWGVSASNGSGFAVYYSSIGQTYTLYFSSQNIRGSYGCLCYNNETNAVCTFVTDTSNNRVVCYEGYNLKSYINSATNVQQCIKIDGMYYLIGFVVGSGGRIHISSDLIGWQDPIQISGALISIAHGNGIFVIITNSNLYISSDGLNYTRYNAPFQDLNKIIFADGYFYIASPGGLARSKNGIDWTTIYSGNNNLCNVGFGNKKLIALGNGGAISTIDFKNYKIISNNNFGIADSVTIAYGNDIFNFTDNNTLFYMNWGIE